MNDPIETATRFHLDLMPAPGTTKYNRLTATRPAYVVRAMLTFKSLGAIIAALLVL